MGRIIGIDLGTTYSAVAVFNEREGKFVIIPSRKGTQTTPSVVGLKDGQVVVGADAKARQALDPDNTIAEIKRHMGEPFLDENKQPRLGPDGKPVPYSVQFAGKQHTPQMISAYILRDLKATAEEYLREPVTAAVITCPAYFTGGPRRATEEAGALAGLEVKCLLSEPTAAAIAFGLGTATQDEDDDKPRRVLVYDLGGGTFDVSIIEIARGNIQVLGVDGDHYLGGVDFDRKIIEWVLRKVREEHGVDLRTTDGVDAALAKAYKKAFSRIYDEAEKTKIALSTQNSATIALPYLFPKDGEMVNVEYEITRNEFLTLIGPTLKGTLATVDRAIEGAKLAKEQIDDVLLVGGSTRIPKVREMLEKHFGKPPRKDINPDECVALGAAMQALRYVDTKTVSPEAEAKVEEQLSKMGEVIDITGHSLGVREGIDNMSVLIPKNTAIPAMAEQLYQTGRDFQKSVQVVVYQGEDAVASKNTMLTEFDVPDLPPLPQGQVKLKIRFELDVNGVLRIQVVNLMTNKPVDHTTKYGGSTQARPQDLIGARGASGNGGGSAPPKPAGPAAPAGPAIPPSMQDTWRQAEENVKKLSGANKQKLEAAMKDYVAALGKGDKKAAEDKGNALMDVLFDVMI